MFGFKFCLNIFFFNFCNDCLLIFKNQINNVQDRDEEKNKNNQYHDKDILHSLFKIKQGPKYWKLQCIGHILYSIKNVINVHVTIKIFMDSVNKSHNYDI